MGIGGMSIWQLLLLALIGWILVAVVRAVTNSGGSGLICSRCGTANRARTHTRGSIFIELLLWLMFIIPGLIYSIWRLTTRGKVCAVCGSADLVPLTSPAGRELVARYGDKEGPATHGTGAALPAEGAEAQARAPGPVSRSADTGFSITGADEPPAPRRSGTRPTGSSTPSGGRRE